MFTFEAIYAKLTLTMLSSQDLALEARNHWLQWNKDIKESRPSDLPQPLTPEDELLTTCGVYHLADGPGMIDRYVENLQVMEKTAPEFRDLQFIKVRLNKISLEIYIHVFNIGYRAVPRTRRGPRHWVQNGPRSITFLTTLGMVAPTGFLMQAPESLWQTK